MRLTCSREEARTRLTARVEAGETILGRELPGLAEANEAKQEYWSWNEYNERLLEALFTDRRARDAYHQISFGGPDRDASLREVATYVGDNVRSQVRRLRSAIDMLDLAEEPSGQRAAPSRIASAADAASKDVFIVHGRDEAAKQKVARFVERLGFVAVILHEQANRSRALIQKFEDHTEKVAFAIVLLTPDDVGGLATEKPDLQHRARQNVIFELGYLIGRLGRGHVCGMKSGAVEVPSDWDGVTYVSLDDGSWQFQLGREMKAAGLDVDMNLAV